MSAAVATIHPITEARVSYRAADVHRCPDELLASDLSDRNVRVWLAVRKVQGSNDRAWATYAHYGELCGKSASVVGNAVAELEAAGWLVEVGRRGRTPELRCVVPTGRPPGAAPESSRSMTKVVTERDDSRHGACGPSSRSMKTVITERDDSYIRIESGQEPYQESSSQQQQQQGTGLNDPGGGEQKPERYPYSEKGAKLLIGNGVFPAVAAKLVTEHPPRRVNKEIARLKATQQLGPVKDPGGLLVRWLRGEEEPLPGFDEVSR